MQGKTDLTYSDGWIWKIVYVENYHIDKGGNALGNYTHGVITMTLEEAKEQYQQG